MAADVGISSFIVWDGQPPSHYTFGFHGSGPRGGGSERRAVFGAYAGGLAESFSGLFDLPAREAWAEANEILESADVSWAYRRTTSPSHDTYRARSRATEPAELGAGQSWYTARGSC